jgi:hypothetical protein
MVFDVTDDEKLALVAHLRHALEHDPFPHAPRLDPLKTILAKLEPPAPQPEPLPPLKAGMAPSVGAGAGEIESVLDLFFGPLMSADYRERG